MRTTPIPAPATCRLAWCAERRSWRPSPDLGCHRWATSLLVRTHDDVTGVGHAELIRPSDDARDDWEVEPRRRRGDLPLDRLGPPRVSGRLRTPAPADGH